MKIIFWLCFDGSLGGGYKQVKEFDRLDLGRGVVREREQQNNTRRSCSEVTLELLCLPVLVVHFSRKIEFL